MLGLLVGDALGVPYEFTPSRDIPVFDLIEMAPPAGFNGLKRAPAGTWSDDGSQALCLLASLLERGSLDTKDLSARILKWFDEGYMAVDGKVFDIGIQTHQALNAIRQGRAPESAGGTGERDNGNGSLMRVLPLALWHQGTDAQLVADAMRQSSLTHGHNRSKVACALYCMWARVAMQECSRFDLEFAFARTYPHLNAEQRIELENLMVHQPMGSAWGSGYVFDSFASAREALKQPTFEGVVKKAISFGQDTDTTACIAGGIAGIYYSEDGIPRRWLQNLRGRDLLDPLLKALVAHREL